MNWKWPEPFRKWKGALGKYQAVLLVVAVGALLLLLPAGGGDGAARSQEDEAAEMCIRDRSRATACP